ncbi:acyl--CoA ligase [Streptomyces spongiicola]|uniref:Acyl--CoA ligase n=1 Tax=Streptomyces spongiicola TaxID=1690221 RepID=A0A2S1YXN1_9ACTN|nr:AMP-binding protein [Streptomyces spongiicola]AWK08877.1 acyl--CoA ligase [Streptomyces spongiicola]GBP99778.1 acyl--CoA ligase [Streptomyces spongiicola]
MTATTVRTPVSAPTADRMAEYRRRGWWRDETFLDDLRRQARERPRKLAIAGRRLGEARTDTLDYAELARLTDRFAGALLELGVERGDVVAVQLPNRWEMVPLMFACTAVGAVICPIAPVCREEELHHRLALTEARVCVTVAEWDGYPLAETINALRHELPLEHVVVVDGHAPEGAVDFHDHFVSAHWEKQRTGDLEGRALRPDEPFVVLFTSGTTGFSKGVVHSQNTVHSGVRGYADTFLLRDDMVVVVTTPLVHYSGFGQGVLAGVMLGGTIAFQDGPDHVGLLDLVERYGATLLYGPPPTLSGVAAAQQTEPRDVSSLRHTITGAAPVLQELVDELRDTFGARTYSVWGMSEFGPVTITRLDYNQDWAAHSHGRPIDSMEIRIDQCHDAGRRAPVGRLRVRGASQALGYYKQQDAFDSELTSDGWFDTGDVAREDGRGGIRILGRSRDTILRDGIVVPMAELEAILSRHPGVAEAALLGPTGQVDDPILAVAVPRGGARPTLPEIRDHLRDHGQDPRFFPERLEVVDVLPKTLTGKVRKVELRERFSGG